LMSLAVDFHLPLHLRNIRSFRCRLAGEKFENIKSRKSVLQSKN
jgi:hypothetical protein